MGCFRLEFSEKAADLQWTQVSIMDDIMFLGNRNKIADWNRQSAGRLSAFVQVLELIIDVNV